MAENDDDQDELAELKMLMQRNAEALERLREMVATLEAMLSSTTRRNAGDVDEG